MRNYKFYVEENRMEFRVPFRDEDKEKAGWGWNGKCLFFILIFLGQNKKGDCVLCEFGFLEDFFWVFGFF